MNAPAKIPSSNDEITSLDINARIIAMNGGNMVNHPILAKFMFFFLSCMSFFYVLYTISFFFTCFNYLFIKMIIYAYLVSFSYSEKQVQTTPNLPDTCFPVSIFMNVLHIVFPEYPAPYIKRLPKRTRE